MKRQLKYFLKNFCDVVMDALFINSLNSTLGIGLNNCHNSETAMGMNNILRYCDSLNGIRKNKS